VWGLDLSGSLSGAGGVGGLLMFQDDATTNTGTYFPTYDGNGNVTGLVNGNTGTLDALYEYGPFGKLLRMSGTAASADNAFRFSTKWQDGLNDLYYYGYRFYNADTGRWLNKDPMEEQGGANLYGFVENDPISKFDPTGEESVIASLAAHAPRRVGIAQFKYRFLLIPIAPPAVTLEGTLSFKGEVVKCCSGLMLVGTVSVRGSVGIGTAVGGKVYDPTGRGSKWRDPKTGRFSKPPGSNSSLGLSGSYSTSLPPCKTTIKGSVDIGISGYASAGLGSFSAGPEFDWHYSFNFSEDPNKFSFSAGLGSGRGSGARIEGYVQGNASGQVVLNH
jgi:RHS repeat-associated protein